MDIFRCRLLSPEHRAVIREGLTTFFDEADDTVRLLLSCRGCHGRDQKHYLRSLNVVR